MQTPGLQQYEDILSPDESTQQPQECASVRLQENRAPASGLQVPPAETVVAVIEALLINRSDAAVILANTAGRLGFELQSAMPGPGMQEVAHSRCREAVEARSAVRVEDAFAQWCAHAARERHLKQRLPLRSPTYTIESTKASPWGEQDAALRARTVSPPPTPPP